MTTVTDQFMQILKSTTSDYGLTCIPILSLKDTASLDYLETTHDGASFNSYW